MMTARAGRRIKHHPHGTPNPTPTPTPTSTPTPTPTQSPPTPTQKIKAGDPRTQLVFPKPMARMIHENVSLPRHHENERWRINGAEFLNFSALSTPLCHWRVADSRRSAAIPRGFENHLRHDEEKAESSYPLLLINPDSS